MSQTDTQTDSNDVLTMKCHKRTVDRQTDRQTDHNNDVLIIKCHKRTVDRQTYRQTVRAQQQCINYEMKIVDRQTPKYCNSSSGVQHLV